MKQFNCGLLEISTIVRLKDSKFYGGMEINTFLVYLLKIGFLSLNGTNLKLIHCNVLASSLSTFSCANLAEPVLLRKK